MRESAADSSPAGCGSAASPLTTRMRQVVQRARPPHTEACGMPLARSVSSTVAPGSIVMLRPLAMGELRRPMHAGRSNRARRVRQTAATPGRHRSHRPTVAMCQRWAALLRGFVRDAPSTVRDEARAFAPRARSGFRRRRSRPSASAGISTPACPRMANHGRVPSLGAQPEMQADAGVHPQRQHRGELQIDQPRRRATQCESSAPR